MIARFPGTCRKCGQAVHVGDQITWNRTQRGVVYHVACPTSSETSETSSYAAMSATATTTATVPAVAETHTNGDLAATLAQAIADYLPAPKAVLDEQAIRDIVQREIAHLTMPTRVELVVPATQEVRDMGVQHKDFPRLLTVVSCGLNVWLAGPTGSGKTQAAMNAAKALGLRFYFCGAQSNEYGLSGYIDAKGQVVRTLFREAYEHGGVFLFDEVDASSANALLWLNAALSNGHCAFPDAVVAKHPDFICIAAANTWGRGSTNDYVGRFKMDESFLKRFVFVSWDYDEALELAISGNPQWAKRVQTVRARVRAKGIKVIISPRETLYGARLLAAGLPQEDVEAMTIFAGMSPEQIASVR